MLDETYAEPLAPRPTETGAATDGVAADEPGKGSLKLLAVGFAVILGIPVLFGLVVVTSLLLGGDHEEFVLEAEPDFGDLPESETSNFARLIDTRRGSPDFQAVVISVDGATSLHLDDQAERTNSLVPVIYRDGEELLWDRSEPLDVLPERCIGVACEIGFVMLDARSVWATSDGAIDIEVRPLGKNLDATQITATLDEPMSRSDDAGFEVCLNGLPEPQNTSFEAVRLWNRAPRQVGPNQIGLHSTRVVPVGRGTEACDAVFEVGAQIWGSSDPAASFDEVNLNVHITSTGPARAPENLTAEVRVIR